MQRKTKTNTMTMTNDKDKDKDEDKDKDKDKPDAFFLQNKQTLGPISLLPFKSPF